MVEKHTEPVERVRVAKETIHGEETVYGEIRKEHIETEDDVQPGQGTGRAARGR